MLAPRAARPRRAARRRGDRRQVRRLAAPAASRPHDTHFVSVDENVTPVQGRRATATRPEIEQELAARARASRVTFTPHLVPLAQGELVSCYVTPARAHERRRGRARSTTMPTRDEPWVEVVDGPPGRARRARDQLLPHLGALRRPRTGRIIVFAAIDNLWKGTASQAVQNLNLMFGRDESEGAGA